ncbi:hypothetical protein QTI05_24055 [Variovorax sp. J22R193]|uniref:hypothetical protein n=1 Tax=Variovorax fucosicus TaxID=3053517 RepID=UPI002576C9A4|nr:hypothetical protein [Variovorax sp. J22R193]MDM0042133.1 hypothetical protein [Variovorax sp. J22R193]
MNWLLKLFTDGTNADPDYSKVLGAVGIAVFLGISFYAYGIRGAAFSPIEWATGWSIVAGVAGVVSKLRDRTAPPPTP